LREGCGGRKLVVEAAGRLAVWRGALRSARDRTMSAMSWGTVAVLLPRRRWRRTRIPLLLAAVMIVLGLLSGNAVAEKSKKCE